MCTYRVDQNCDHFIIDPKQKLLKLIPTREKDIHENKKV
jgi:hypothetical protein